MLQKWKLTKIGFTKPHENITYKGSNKANAQHHKAACNRYYICYNTDMFSQSLESQTDFIMFKHGNHWKWSATYSHTLQWITLTLMKTEQSFYHSGNTGKSHNPYIWHLFSALSVSLCNIFYIFSFLGHNRDNWMRCEHTVFLNKRNISMYIKICKLPNQLCCKV